MVSIMGEDLWYVHKLIHENDGECNELLSSLKMIICGEFDFRNSMHNNLAWLSWSKLTLNM